MPTGLVRDGDIRFLRMDSVSDATSLPEGSFIFSHNMINRGGVLQTRPGFRWKFTLPDGRLQGLAVFTPRLGMPELVAFVSGVGYVSQYPFTEFTEIPGARMSATAKQVFMVQATQSVDRNPDDSLRFITPRALLMVQDGLAPPAYYDGLNLTALTGLRRTPQGTHMAWAGARLWVARREQLFASDIADPTHFIEQETNMLGGIQYFLLPGLCRGLKVLPGVSSDIKTPLLAFTDSTTTIFQSNILNRSLWSTTENFQATILPSVGCVAHRSLVAHAGKLWWFSEFGLVNIDSAEASNITSKIDFLDREMVRSARRMSQGRDVIASASYENFLLFSVPHASKKNTHTWVHDASINDMLTEEFPEAWASVWTGVSPVEWAHLTVNGNPRLFCASVDDDGKNRIYEAFTSSRRDNGCDFPWFWESRGYTGGALTPKHLRYLEYALSEVQGEVNLKISWAGTNRGRWKEMDTTRFFAKEGNLDAATIYTADSPLYALKKQSRVARTQDVRDLEGDSLSSAGVEGPIYAVEADKETIDSAFSFRFDGSGPCAFRGIRVFMDAEQEPDSGQAREAESDDHFVRFDGAAASAEAALQEAPEVFSATKTASAKYRNYSATRSGSAQSVVSQEDADKRARQAAEAAAEEQLLETVAPYQGGSEV